LRNRGVSPRGLGARAPSPALEDAISGALDCVVRDDLGLVGVWSGGPTVRLYDSQGNVLGRGAVGEIPDPAAVREGIDLLIDQWVQNRRLAEDLFK
jgi:hypothetical protein